MDENPQERPPGAKERKTVYDVGYASIFFRNFLAGFAHALGAVFLYLIIITILYYTTATLIVPRLQSLISPLLPLLELKKQSNGLPGTSQTVSPEQLEAIRELFEQEKTPTNPPPAP